MVTIFYFSFYDNKWSWAKAVCFSAPFNVGFKITDIGDLHTGLGSGLSQAIYITADKNDST